MTSRFFATAAALAVAFPLVVTAETGEPVAKESLQPSDRMTMTVISHVNKQLENLTTSDKVLALAIIAKQDAAATICDNINMDPDLYSAAILDAMSDVTGAVPEGANNLPLNIMTKNYGTLVGGELAMAAYDPDGYCAYAAELLTELAAEPDKKLLVLRTTP